MAEDIGALEFRVIANLESLAAAERRMAELRDKYQKGITLNIDASYASIQDAMDVINAMERRLDDMSLTLGITLNKGDLDIVQATIDGLRAKVASQPLVLRVVTETQGSGAGSGAWQYPSPIGPMPATTPIVPTQNQYPSPIGPMPENRIVPTMNQYSEPIGPMRVQRIVRTPRQYEEPIGPPAAPQYSEPIGPPLPPQYPEPIGPMPAPEPGGTRGGFLGSSIFRHYWTYNFGAMVLGRGMQAVGQGLTSAVQMGAAARMAGYNALGAATRYNTARLQIKKTAEEIPIAGPVATGLVALAQGGVDYAAHTGWLKRLFPSLPHWANELNSPTQELKDLAQREQLHHLLDLGRSKSLSLRSQAEGTWAKVTGSTSLALTSRLGSLRATYEAQQSALRQQLAKEQAMTQDQGENAMVISSIHTQLASLRDAYQANVAAARAAVTIQRNANGELENDALIARRFARTGQMGLQLAAEANEKIASLMRDYRATGNMKYQAEAILAKESLSAREHAYAERTRQMQIAGMPTQTTAQVMARLKAEQALALQQASQTGLTPQEIAARQAVIRQAFGTRMQAATELGARRDAEAKQRAQMEAARTQQKTVAASEFMAALRERLKEVASPDTSQQARAKYNEQIELGRIAANRDLTSRQKLQAEALEAQIYGRQREQFAMRDAMRHAKVMDPEAVFGSAVAGKADRHVRAAEETAQRLAELVNEVKTLTEKAGAGVAAFFHVGA